MSKDSRNQHIDLAGQNFAAGIKMIKEHPLFCPLLDKASVIKSKDKQYPELGLAIVGENGHIYCNSKLRAEPAKWARVIAHCLLHLGMGHFKARSYPDMWNIACDCVVEKFLTDLKFGMPYYEASLPIGINDEERLHKRLFDGGDNSQYIGFGTAGDCTPDMLFNGKSLSKYHKPPDWQKLFAIGLQAAVKNAVRTIALGNDAKEFKNSRANHMKQWFISSYPLLGAIAANFKVIEDPIACQRMQITIAAVSPALAEIYINSAYHLDDEELRFVLAHEFLHAALRHDARKEWRNLYFWNVACDYVINDWLKEMAIGQSPDGILYDAQFKGMNAEAVYDHIVTDMRYYRKLATLRGVGLGDILSGKISELADVDLDNFYRRALSQGLTYHQSQERGYLPQGLIEEIRSLSHPPIPWDVELASWFDEHFTPLEKTRSYARPSRRQSSTPTIPRPNWVTSKSALDGRTFGVVLDTSGSMERYLLATALGAIASYSTARDIPAARVVFCDAYAYDAGYLSPFDIAGSVKVKGRGGTILQSGIDLLHKADDFSKDAPILIITDGACDKVVLYGREHAFLIPKSVSLPFIPKGKVFRMR